VSTPDDNPVFERLQQLRDDAREAFNEGARGVPLSVPLDAETAMLGLIADRLNDLIPEAYALFQRRVIEKRRAA
jgi:hypothetical protein